MRKEGVQAFFSCLQLCIDDCSWRSIVVTIVNCLRQQTLLRESQTAEGSCRWTSCRGGSSLATRSPLFWHAAPRLFAYVVRVDARVRQLVRTRGVIIEEFELVEQALDEYAGGKADFADYLILGKARRDASELLTFDKKLAREVGTTLL